MTNKQGSAVIALGSNQAHAGLSGAALLKEAVRHFAPQQLRVLTRSSVWVSPPWPPSHNATNGQADYVNAIVTCDVGARDPDDVVAILHEIERSFGRTRRVRWEARTLDLDLIDLDARVGSFKGVILPHPHTHERAFVLAPLAEAAPAWRHPVLNKNAAELLAELPDAASTRRIADLNAER